MNYRYMRMLLFFDLPTVESDDRRAYNQFRKHLIQSGFMMLQESVYCKLLLNSTAATLLAADLRRHKPPKGLMQILVITEKQYGKMEYLLGEHQSEILDSDERLVIL